MVREDRTIIIPPSCDIPLKQLMYLVFYTESFCLIKNGRNDPDEHAGSETYSK